MASQNEIANWALDLVGETAITDITDAVEPAERLLAAWGPTRDQALREKLWRFSIARASLSALAAAPTWGFDLQYQINGDVVRVVQVDQYFPPPVTSDYVDSDTAPFLIEGDKILTDITAPLKVRWVVNSVDVGLWDACFARVMACDLADRISTRVTASESIKARIKAERMDALSAAQRANALETPPRFMSDGTWIAARFMA